MNHHLDGYVNMPWVPVEEMLDDGTYRLTVEGIVDFELFSDTPMREQDEWRTALRSHLQGYLNVGKALPLPLPRFSIPDAGDVVTCWGDADPAIMDLPIQQLLPSTTEAG